MTPWSRCNQDVMEDSQSANWKFPTERLAAVSFQGGHIKIWPAESQIPIRQRLREGPIRSINQIPETSNPLLRFTVRVIFASIPY